MPADLKYYAQNPDEAKNKLSSDSGQPSKIDGLKDEIMFWKETIEEIRQNNPELEQSIKDYGRERNHFEKISRVMG